MDKGHPATPDDKCTCAEAGYTAVKHGCPYAEEINDDFETLCTCCPACTHECAMDI